MKEIIFFPETERGKSELSWLKSNFSFSFANYYNPEKMGFGTLRVLNNDVVKAGTWFWMHHHDNMEIITIPLSGSLTHKDSLWNEWTIHPGEVQSMSAWSGIEHSEVNMWTEDGEFFQIWIETKNQDINPEYHQKTFSSNLRNGTWQLLAGPQKNQENVIIHQDAFISQASLWPEKSLDYQTYLPWNMLYIMNISWKFELEWHMLNYRDAIGLVWYDTIEIKSSTQSDILLIEVPPQTRYI